MSICKQFLLILGTAHKQFVIFSEIQCLLKKIDFLFQREADGSSRDLASSVLSGEITSTYS